MSALSEGGFTHVITTAEGVRHRVGPDGRNHAGFRPNQARSIRPIQQDDGSWPSLPKGKDR